MLNPSSISEADSVSVAAGTILGTTRASLVFAITMFVATTVQVLATPVAALIDGGGEWPFELSEPLVLAVLVLGCGVQAATLMVADRFPKSAVAVVTLVFLVLAIGLEVPTWLTGMYLVISLALFLLATHCSAATALAWLVLTVGAVAAGLLAWVFVIGTHPGVAFWWLAAEVARFAAPAAAATTLGLWWAGKVRRMRAVREEAERSRHEHEERVALAQANERARIAQELHDVAGQHLAGLITLADAALKLAPERPEHALELVEDVRDEGRFAAASLAGALADLRATSPDSAASIPDLRRASELIDYWRGRGMSVTYASSAGIFDLPAVVSTTAYRCLQEALTNVAKHSPGADVDADVILSSERLAVSVVNSPSTTSGSLPGLGLGWGLHGILERVELLQGTLTAHPTPAGGWELRVEIPTTTSS